VDNKNVVVVVVNKLNRRRWLSTVHEDLKQHHLTLAEAADLAQNGICGG